MDQVKILVVDDEAEICGLTKSILRASITFSSGVLRSKKTVSRVSEKLHWQTLQRKIRRLPLCVRYVAMELTFPRFIRP